MNTQIRSFRNAVFVLLAALTLTSCTGMLQRPETPQVSIADIGLIEAGVLEQQYAVKLRLQNPNDYDLAIDGASIQISINNQSFMTGVTGTTLTIPRFDSATLDIKATTTLMGMVRQLREMATGKTSSVRFKLMGKVHLSKQNMSIPFEQEGDLDLSFLDKKPGTGI